MKRIAIIDNYDSFTYNLVHYVGMAGADAIVFRNDEFDISDLNDFTGIIISPGPGLPKDAGLTMSVIRNFASSKSILGICLGQQAIAEYFGGSLVNLEKVYHGVATKLIITDFSEPLFNGVPDGILVGRYHSWTAKKDGLPEDLHVTSVDENGEIMSLRHRFFDIRALQFHPESILTEYGKTMIYNWIQLL